MQYFIKEWPDHTATLYAEDGYALKTFLSVEAATSVCRKDCLVEPIIVENPYAKIKRRFLFGASADFEYSYA